MMSEFLKSLFVGVKRRWTGGIVRALSVVGGLWLLTEVVTRASQSANQALSNNGDAFLVAILVAGIAGFLIYVYERRSVSFDASPTSKITIRFGNLLDCDTDWLVGINEFFDSQLGQIVSPRSVHGQVIASVFGGDENRFRTEVDQALQHFPAIPTERTIEPSSRYEIGTTAVVANGSHKVFLMVMAHTDLAAHKATTTPPILWTALMGGLQSVRDYGNGNPISMPLVGNGQSSVPIKPQHLLRLVTMALVDFGRRVSLPKSVTIVVAEECFEVLNIREIKRDWSRLHGI
jgi:hypothetical protein